MKDLPENQIFPRQKYVLSICPAFHYNRLEREAKRMERKNGWSKSAGYIRAVCSSALNWRSWRLKNKMAATFTLLFMAAIFGLGGLAYLHMKKDYTDRTLDLVHTSLAQMTATVDLYIQDMERLSLAVFSDPIIQRILRRPTSDYGVQYDNNEMTYRLVQLTSPWPYIQGVYLFAEDGRTFNISKGSGIASDYSIRQEPWYGAVSEGQETSIFYWPTGLESTALRNPQQVFSLIRPIHDLTTDKRTGYLKIDMHVQAMKSMLVNAAKEKNDLPLRYLLLDKDRRVIYDSKEQVTGQALPAELEAAMAEPEGSAIWSGTRYLFSSNTSKYNKWTIMAISPYADVVKQSLKIRGLILLIGALSVLVVGFASYTLAAGISRPLTSLIRNMKRAEGGDFKVRAEYDGQRDEIGRLSRVFNMMLESVDNLVHQVFQLNIKEKDAQLMALQAQINPHMLFNTLNAMKALSRKQGAHDVGDMAENLADLFRYSMKGWNKPVTLAEELEHVQNYILIQEVRFRHRLTYEPYVPESLLGVPVAKLTIQPLVENAIVHGIEKRIEGGTITLRVSIRSEDKEQSEVEITVADTGPGIPAEQVAVINAVLAADDRQSDEMPESKSGIGLLNIHKRIRLLFGAPYGLRIESEAERGAKVTVRLPYRTDRT